MILLLLWGCTGDKDSPPTDCVDAAPVPDPTPESWDPVLEEDLRIDEASAVWVGKNGGFVDGAATVDCASPPCMALRGPGSAETSVLLDRAAPYTLSGTVTTDVPVDLTVVQFGPGASHDVLTLALPVGTTTLAEDFTLAAAGGEVRIGLGMADSGTLTLDGFQIVGERWAASTAPPTGMVRLGFLLHIEDDANFLDDEATWERRAVVVEGISAMLAAHGAQLDLQADASFVRGTTTWDPEWFAAREAEGTVWSVHIHDEEGGEEDAEQAIRDGREALRDAGVSTSDLNGGFAIGLWSVAEDAGIRTLTAYKDPSTQLGLPHVQIQPWRPADGTTTADPAAFMAHDPDGPLLYLPGYDTREADHTRFPTASAQVLSQVLAHARDGYVNTWYYVLHIDAFGPDASHFQAYLDSGGLTDDLANYDAFLTETVDPLVAGGSIIYDGPEGMFRAWEAFQETCPE